MNEFRSDGKIYALEVFGVWFFLKTVNYSSFIEVVEEIVTSILFYYALKVNIAQIDLVNIVLSILTIVIL